MLYSNFEGVYPYFILVKRLNISIRCHVKDIRIEGITFLAEKYFSPPLLIDTKL